MSARRPRVFVGGAGVEEGRVRLDADESHHLLRVLRARAGDEVVAFDGAGGEWAATIDEASAGSVVLRVGAPTGRAAEPPVRITLVQALVRPEKLELLLQKGTEVGIASFLLVGCGRAEAEPPSPSRAARYRRVLLEACKQSGRLVVPSLAVSGWPPTAPGGIVLDPAPGTPPIGRVLAGPRRAAVSLAVGPEGGFTPEEIGALEAAGGVRCSLGPRVLRTETAGVVAAALILHAWGDLGSI